MARVIGLRPRTRIRDSDPERETWFRRVIDRGSPGPCFSPALSSLSPCAAPPGISQSTENPRVITHALICHSEQSPQGFLRYVFVKGVIGCNDGRGIKPVIEFAANATPVQGRVSCVLSCSARERKNKASLTPVVASASSAWRRRFGRGQEDGDLDREAEREMGVRTGRKRKRHGGLDPCSAPGLRYQRFPGPGYKGPCLFPPPPPSVET